MLNRLIVLGLLTLAAAALLVPAAAADRPSKEPFPSSPLSGQFCDDFQVRLEPIQDKAVLHVFSSGVALLTGVLKVKVTNLTTGESLELNISGPGKFSPDGSTITGTGRWLLFGEDGQLPEPGPGMLLVTGHMVIGLGPNGIASLETKGTVEDVCAALAA